MATKTGTGSAVALNGGWTPDPATNRVTTFYYDANGNQTYSNGFNLTFDVMNRMNSAESSSQTSNYEYDSANKRIFEARWSGGVKQGEWMYFFGVTGQRLGKYYVNVTGGVSPAVTFSITDASVWFAGRLVQKGDPSIGVSFVGQDRLGSVGKYLPYGEDKPGATNPGGDQEKFATYTRDGVTGLDYADQRWHVSGAGRFLSADPYQGSARARDPGSWNRYGYTRDEPVNRRDVTGTCDDDLFPTFVAEPCNGNTGGATSCTIGGQIVDCDAAFNFAPTAGPQAGPQQNGLCYSIGGFAVCLNKVLPPPLPSAAAPPDPHDLCMAAEALNIGGVLGARHSPLAAYAELIVNLSDAFDLDDRFIVALGALENGSNWGPNNIFNNGAHNPSGYPSVAAAIQDVIQLLATDNRYVPYSSTVNIYSVYERGDVPKISSRQGALDSIYGGLGGDKSNIRRHRYP